MIKIFKKRPKEPSTSFLAVGPLFECHYCYLLVYLFRSYSFKTHCNIVFIRSWHFGYPLLIRRSSKVFLSSESPNLLLKRPFLASTTSVRQGLFPEFLSEDHLLCIDGKLVHVKVLFGSSLGQRALTLDVASAQSSWILDPVPLLQIVGIFLSSGDKRESKNVQYYQYLKAFSLLKNCLISVIRRYSVYMNIIHKLEGKNLPKKVQCPKITNSVSSLKRMKTLPILFKSLHAKTINS